MISIPGISILHSNKPLFYAYPKSERKPDTFDRLDQRHNTIRQKAFQKHPFVSISPETLLKSPITAATPLFLYLC